MQQHQTIIIEDVRNAVNFHAPVVKVMKSEISADQVRKMLDAAMRLSVMTWRSTVMETGFGVSLIS